MKQDFLSGALYARKRNVIIELTAADPHPMQFGSVNEAKRASRDLQLNHGALGAGSLCVDRLKQGKAK
jgi:hypothetical protein